MSLEKKVAEGYTCGFCEKVHKYPAYVFAHWRDRINHTCDCGAVHEIQNGIASLMSRPSESEVKPNEPTHQENPSPPTRND